jgi:hypothetical protein
MTLPIVTNLVNFCLLMVRLAKILVKSIVELCKTTVSVTALQNNEMPIGVDHRVTDVPRKFANGPAK